MKWSHVFVAASFASCVIALTPSSILAQNTATLGASGDWTNPAVWTTVPPGNFPNNNNPNAGDLWDVTISGAFAVNADSSITINNLLWAFGSINGSNPLELQGNGSVFSGGVNKFVGLNAADLRNSGTITMSGTNLRAEAAGSGLTNLSGALFDITGDGGAMVNNFTGTFHNNAGATLRKSAGVGTSTIQWTFNNSGAVQVQTGTLAFTGAGTHTGTLNVAAGAFASFSNFTHTLDNGAVFQGAGTTVLGGAILALANNATVNIDSIFHHNSGSLATGGNASSTLNLNGNYNWVGGDLGSSGVVNLNGTANVFSSATNKNLNLQAANLRNAGTITLSGTNLRALAVGSGLTNLAGALFDVTSDGTALFSNIGTFHNNAGATFRKSAGVGTTTIQWTFNNNGAVQVQTGTLAFTGAGTHTGTFNVAAGAFVSFNNLAHTLDNGVAFLGSGTTVLSVATLALTNNATINIDTIFNHNSGSLATGGNASSTLNLNGNYNWVGGDLGSSGLVNLNGTANEFSSATNKNLNLQAANLRNAGTITLSGTNLRSFVAGSGLTNLAGALFDITSDGTALINSNVGTFNNNAGATFRKSAGAGISTVAWNFNNSGTVLGQSGTLNFTGSYTQSATGSLTVDGGTVQLAGSPTLQGNLGGSGTIQATSITHADGVISPGLSAGTLAFTGSLTLSATSVLDFELGAVSDLITVGGNLTVNGTLNISALSGFVDGAYTLFEYQGTFADNGLTLGDFPPGGIYSLFHDAPNSRLQVVVSAIPEPGLLIVGGAACAGLSTIWSRSSRVFRKRQSPARRASGKTRQHESAKV